MKRLISLLLIVAMMSCVLCACGDGDICKSTEPQDTDPSQSQSASIPVPSSTAAQNNGRVTYTVTVVDQNGNGVAGVVLQFCDADSCRLPVETDGSGVVSQSYLESEYHITLNTIPDGYSSDETTFYFDGSTELTIVLNAAE